MSRKETHKKEMEEFRRSQKQKQKEAAVATAGSALKTTAAAPDVTTYRTPGGITPFGLSPGLRLENSILNAKQQEKEYSGFAETFAQKALNEELLGNYPDSRYLWSQAAQMDQKSKEAGAKAAFFREVVQNPAAFYSPPGSAPKPAKPTSKTTAKTASAPSGTYADRENVQLQIDRVSSEMDAYIKASGGKADDSVLNWYDKQLRDLSEALEALPTKEAKFAPNFKNRLTQMGNSATSDIVGGFIQTAATVTEGLSQYASTDGSLEELHTTLNQLMQEYNAYLSAGISESNTLVTQLKDAIDNTKAQIEYVQSGQRGKDTADARQELYSIAGDYYEAADTARDNAAKGLNTVGQIMVDVGIEGIKLLFDQGMGKITGGTSTGSALLRSFGEGAYKSAEAGWGVQKQIGDGLKSSAVEYLMGKFVDKDGVLDKLDDGLIKQIANSIGGNEKLIEHFAKVPVNMMGVYLTTFMFACAETAFNESRTGNTSHNDTKKVTTDAINNFISSSISYIPQLE